MSDQTRQDRQDLPPAAQRALAEADERRKAAEAQEPRPKELGGRDGPDPARYGDWEKKRASPSISDGQARLSV